MKKYIIVERNEDYKCCLILNEDTTSLGDVWWSMVPYKIDKKELDKIKPKVFNSRSEAIKYRKILQLNANEDWKKNGYVHMMWGKQKQKWKIENYTDNRDIIS